MVRPGWFPDQAVVRLLKINLEPVGAPLRPAGSFFAIHQNRNSQRQRFPQ